MAQCEAVVADLDGDGKDDVLILESWRGTVLAEDAHGWSVVGQFEGPLSCAPVREALRAGHFEAAPPLHWRDLQVGDRRLRFVTTPESVHCP